MELYLAPIDKWLGENRLYLMIRDSMDRSNLIDKRKFIDDLCEEFTELAEEVFNDYTAEAEEECSC
jgi:hypothetical protein